MNQRDGGELSFRCRMASIGARPGKLGGARVERFRKIVELEAAGALSRCAWLSSFRYADRELRATSRTEVMANFVLEN